MSSNTELSRLEVCCNCTLMFHEYYCCYASDIRLNLVRLKAETPTLELHERPSVLILILLLVIVTL